jgi:hypothetical protein
MASTASIAPADGNLLCGGCGYIVTGLPQDGNCPECGRSIAKSLPGHRRPSAFETGPSIGSFLKTAFMALVIPARLFSSLTTRTGGTRAAWFARCHRAVAASMLAVAVCGLIIIGNRFKSWLLRAWGSSPPRYEDFVIDVFGFRTYWADEPVLFSLLLLPVSVAAYICILLVTRVAVVISLAVLGGVGPQPIVLRRAMCLHSVHLVPVAFAFAATVGGPLSLQLIPMAVIFYVVIAQITVWIAGGRGLPRRLGIVVGLPVVILMTAVIGWYFSVFETDYFEPLAFQPSDWRLYLYALSGIALLCTAWLLLSGWIAIRNVMYAND